MYMNAKKICLRLCACIINNAGQPVTQPQKPVQHKAQPISEPVDTTVKTDSPSTVDTTLPASQPADTTTKTEQRREG